MSKKYQFLELDEVPISYWFLSYFSYLLDLLSGVFVLMFFSSVRNTIIYALPIFALSQIIYFFGCRLDRKPLGKLLVEDEILGKKVISLPQLPIRLKGIQYAVILSWIGLFFTLVSKNNLLLQIVGLIFVISVLPVYWLYVRNKIKGRVFTSLAKSPIGPDVQVPLNDLGWKDSIFFLVLIIGLLSLIIYVGLQFMK